MAPRLLQILTIFFLSSQLVLAQDINTEDIEDPNRSGVVVVEQPEEYGLSYKKRRTKHGALFSINTEKFYPTDYISLFQDGYVEDIISDRTIDLVGIELGYKHNVGAMSLSVLAAYSSGAISGALVADKRTISVNKQALSGNIALDGILEEPWVVPYAQAGIHQFNVSESNALESLSATTGISFNYRYGLLFQIDWIENLVDKTAKLERLKSSGLENTYIDFYFSDHLASSSAADPSDLLNEGDPNMLSVGEMGLGLKMEF